MYSIPNEAKLALKDGTYNKNYRFIVLGNDGTEDFVIDNNNLVKESVNLDEKMSSGTDIKFGLCEGSSLEFQYFDYPNITGRRIQAFIDIDYPSTTFNTLKQFGRYEPFEITESGSYRAYSESENAFNKVYLFKGDEVVNYTPISSQGVTYCEFDAIAGDMVEVEWSQLPINDTFLQQRVDSLKIFSIPMGFFDVKESSRQASTGIIKVTAYNKLQSEYLDAKANNILLNSLTNTNLNISMYDIQHILLKDFQIKSPKGEVVVGSHVQVYNLDKEGGRFAAKISSKTYETPLNSYFSREHPNVTFYLNQQCFGYICDLDPNEYYTLDTQIDFSSWEQSLYDYIKTYIDNSKLNIKGTSFLNNILSKTNGCRGLMCIELRKNDAVVARYSDIGYKKYPARVKGGFKDIIGHSFTGCDEVVIWLAYGTDCMTSQTVSNLELYYGVTYSGDDEKYYGINGTVQYYPSFKTLDGESFTRLPYLRDNSACYLLNLSEAEKVTMIANTIPEFTLRDITSATYEIQCLFGKLDRETDLFSGVELNQGEPIEIASKDMYSQLWADEGNVHKWRYLIITYKGLDSNGNETEYKLQRTVDEHGTDNYNMSDNWLFKNLIWTSEQVGAFADAMVQKMRNITWFPFELWCAGLPYAETGDKIEIPLGDETYTSYILQRQLKGIQNLQDTYINGELDIF